MNQKVHFSPRNYRPLAAYCRGLRDSGGGLGYPLAHTHKVWLSCGAEIFLNKAFHTAFSSARKERLRVWNDRSLRCKLVRCTGKRTGKIKLKHECIPVTCEAREAEKCHILQGAKLHCVV